MIYDRYFIISGVGFLAKDTLTDYCLTSSEWFAVIFMTILKKTPSFVSNKFNYYFGHKGTNET